MSGSACGYALPSLLVCLFALAGAQGEDRAAEVQRLLKLIEDEAQRAEAEGYVPHAAAGELAECRRELAAGRAGAARESLLRAKGSLVNLKLPGWCKESRFATRQEVEQDRFPLRGVFFWGRGFALDGFRRWGWWAGNCRPHADAAKVVDEWHQKGQRVLLYLEGCLTPQSYAALPQGEPWANAQAAGYAQQYHHNGEAWWGMSGAFPGWREWMADKMKFAARLGFDGMTEKPLAETISEALEFLRAGHYVALWLADQELGDGIRGKLEELIRSGGGLVWHGQPFGGGCCPVEAEGPSRPAASVRLLSSPLTDPVARLKAVFSGNFAAERARVKEWAKTVATWQDGTPAIVVSQDPGRRVVWIASDLGMDEAAALHRALRSKTATLTPAQMSEIAPNYALARRKDNLWYLTYLMYNLLSWAAGTE